LRIEIQEARVLCKAVAGANQQGDPCRLGAGPAAALAEASQINQLPQLPS